MMNEISHLSNSPRVISTCVFAKLWEHPGPLKGYRRKAALGWVCLRL